MSTAEQGADTVDLPADVLSEHIIQQCELDCDMRVHAPEGAEVDEWATLKEADVEDVRWEDGDVHLWAETETRIQEKVARATHWQPAEYRNHYCRTHVSVVWDFNPEHNPTVDIEVESP